MKNIKESIIGRRGTIIGDLWLLYPIGDDYRFASAIIPDAYKIRFAPGKAGLRGFAYCINTDLMKKYFNVIGPFESRHSRLYLVNPNYLKSFDDVREFISKKLPGELMGCIEFMEFANPDKNLMNKQ